MGLGTLQLSPILVRELAAAARRRSTTRVRWWAALVAIVMSAGVLGLSALLGGNFMPGDTCFNIQSFYLSGIALLSGVFLTADCLSEEKREGTLGFLLLTDLSEFDIVLGKFAVTSLAAFYGLLALLPIAAVSILLGGVTGAEFWRVSLAQVNLMFVSLAVGMFVSAHSRDPQRAMAGTIGLLLSLVMVVPMVAAGLERAASGAQVLGWVSPMSALHFAKAPSLSFTSNHFWKSLAVSHLAGWACLALATVKLKTAWRDSDTEPTRRRIRLPWFSRGSQISRRSQRRAKLLTKNPVEWLVSSLGATHRYAWGVVALSGCIMLVLCLTQNIPGELQTQFLKPLAFLLKIAFAFQVCRFFVANRRAGALELLLCTPLNQREILQGQARALNKAVFWPCFFLVLLWLTPVGMNFYTGRSTALQEPFMLINIGVECLRLIADFTALCWVGMRLALYMKKPQYASAMTILIVLIAPSVLCWLDLIVDLILISWAKTGLRRDWRELLLSSSSSTSSMPPVIPVQVQPQGQ